MLTALCPPTQAMPLNSCPRLPSLVILILMILIGSILL